MNAPTFPDLSARDALAVIAERGDAFIATLRSLHAPPDGDKTERLYRIKDAAAAVGRSESWLRQSESDPVFPKPAQRSGSHQRLYSLADINAIREYAGTLPTMPVRKPHIIGFVNFKGGSAKTTCAYLASHYLASKGYRVLIVDLDPQGSLTTSFALSQRGQRITSVDWDQTIGPLSADEIQQADGLIHQTHWPTIDVIPASVDLYDAELLITTERTRAPAPKRPVWRRLDALRALPYDFILMDTAPALNMSALNAVVAADGLVIPVPPRNLDLEAAMKFAKVVTAWLDRIPDIPGTRPWLRILLTQVSKTSTSDMMHARLAETVFNTLVLHHVFPLSEAVRRGAAGAPSCYEGGQPATASDANRRVREALDDVFGEILSIALGRAV